jgi:iron complex outermembrane receptor protein
MHSLPSLRQFSLCSVAFAAMAIWTPSQAAETSDESATALSEVVVTAEKRETNLQKTPIAITAMSGEQLETRRIQSLADLVTGGVPGLRVTPFASRPFSLILNIRGVGVMIDTNQPARDPGVGVYIDGVYLGRPQGLNAGLMDVQSFEVLKGPQGTLFGRNTEGGALNIITRKPSGVGRLEAIAGVGNFGSYRTELHIDLPEYNDFRVKLDGALAGRDGIVDNPLTGSSDFGENERRGLRAQVEWRPSDAFTALYAYDASRDASSNLFSYNVSKGSNRLAPITPTLPSRVKTSPVGIPLQPSIGTQSGHALTLTWDMLPELTLKSISSYRELYQDQFSNSISGNVFTPNGPFARYSLALFDQEQYSQEIQAIGETDRLQYVIGALAYHEEVGDMAQTYNSMQFNADGTAATLNPAGSNIKPIAIDLPILFPTAGIDRASRATTDSYGIYGQATYTPSWLDDRLHVTAGLRWTQDAKEGVLTVVNNALPVDAFGKSRVLRFEESWSRIDPMINISFDATPDVMIYGKWSTGYKSGGANSRSLSYQAFDPEEIEMYEVGLKSEFLDRRLRINLAAYWGTYKDFQVDFTAPYYSYDANGNLITGSSTTRTTTDTINAPGEGEVRGFEADVFAVPLEGLTLSASYAYSDVSIPATLNPFPTFVTGVGMVLATVPTRIYQQFTPEHAFTGSVDYARPFQDFTLRVHLDGTWDSGSYATDRDPSPVLAAIKSQDGMVFNGRISLADIELFSSVNMTVSIWSRNLLDAEYLYARNISATNGVTGAFNEPRTFGFEARVRY